MIIINSTKSKTIANKNIMAQSTSLTYWWYS